jgi:hypothetical protein
MRKLSILLTLAIVTVLAIGAQAQISEIWGGGSAFNGQNRLTIDTNKFANTDSGWFDDQGRHFAGNQNYGTGYCSPSNCVYGGYYRGYFSFDLTGFQGKANTATFTVNNYEIGFDPGTLTLFGTSLMPSDVDSSKDWNDIGKYNALNMGPVIGTITLYPAQSNQFSTITLSSDGLAWLSSHAGQGAVIGTEWQAVPEPNSAMLLGSGLIGALGVLRSRFL